ncbi:hypothetical protein, partial [Streptomyces sp. NPDC087294]
MTEPTRNRRIRKPFIYGAVVLVGVGALLAAYLTGAFEKRGNIRADDICLHVPDRSDVAKKFNSILAPASHYDFAGTWRPDRDSGFMSTCFAQGDGDDSLFSLTAQMGSSRPWQQWVKTEIPPNDGGKLTYFDAGLKGAANTAVAAIWVPCYSHEQTTKRPWNMTVFADALKPLEVSGGDARQALIDLATSFARQAHK